MPQWAVIPFSHHRGGSTDGTTADGRTLKMLNVIDEFTLEALAIAVDRCIDADGVVAVLEHLMLPTPPTAYSPQPSSPYSGP